VVSGKLAEDDEEIAALEKKLGLKGKKSFGKSFKDDGLDDLLRNLGEDEDADTRQAKILKAEGDDWLDRKRREAKLGRNKAPETGQWGALKAKGNDSENSSDDDGASDMSLDGPEFPDDVSNDESLISGDMETLDMDNDFDDEDFEDDPPVLKKRPRENPYIAPTSVNAMPSKYIPPSLRKPSSSDSEDLVRLRRQAQGLINRLTEANLISILGDTEKLYRDNPRQHVTSTLVELLLASVCEPTILPDTLIILPAGFITAVYKIIGTDFGAQVIQRIVELFDEHYSRAVATSKDGPEAATSDSSKETSNLIMLLSEMYNFQVVGNNLIFDYVRWFLGKLSELHAELLLRIIRTSGPQLRQDDPSALKDIVAMLRPIVTSVGEENISVRTKFMIETINDLKNNKMKTGGAASAVTSEHTIRMKKILGTLNTRAIKGSEPLRISLKDIRDSDKKGKWWLVGASWSGPVAEDIDRTAVSSSSNINTSKDEYSSTTNLGQLAREQRMNTEVRRAIFIAIMSASDYQDAYSRLMKLQLKKKQEFEIPKILIHCSRSEKGYNPYYTLIAKRLCGDTKLKKCFQFSLWGLFRQLGESDDGEDQQDDAEDLVDTREIVNLAKMFGTLIVEGGLGLGVLKNLNLSYLQPKTRAFVEVLLITVILQSQRQSENKRDEQAVISILTKVKDTPQLLRGIQYFLKKVVSKTDIAGGKEEKKTVRWACKIASDALEALIAIDTVER